MVKNFNSLIRLTAKTGIGFFHTLQPLQIIDGRAIIVNTFMTKLLRIRDYLLLSYAILGDISEDVRLVGDIMPKLMETRYGFVPPNYKRNSYLSSVSKLLSTGEIERKIDSRGQPYLELTSKGQDKFKRKFPVLSLQKKKWDGNFMIVIFDIEEKKRNERSALRLKLKELGFGMLQESVWISPYHFEEDFQEFIESNNLQKFVYVLKARTLMVADYKKLVGKIWNLENLTDEYQNILDLIAEGEKDLKKLWDEYFAIAIKDPMLPKELLPDDWLRERVLETLQKLDGRQ
ncbi:MAG: CRISPR-associated endonuclease Cas2 [bacterium]|nr:CRISPR-associated endonuclease Cas2 [bacterium]